MSSDTPIQAWSFAEREAGFVISHTIHHNAFIGLMVKMSRNQIPEDFDYAPSAIAYQRSNSCAH
jgi:hypothetical protein